MSEHQASAWTRDPLCPPSETRPADFDGWHKGRVSAVTAGSPLEQLVATHSMMSERKARAVGVLVDAADDSETCAMYRASTIKDYEAAPAKKLDALDAIAELLRG